MEGEGLMAKNDGGPAFPESGSRGKAAAGEGMDLRDYFAIRALPLAWAIEQESPTGPYSVPMEPTYAGAAARAYHFADAMLKERAK